MNLPRTCVCGKRIPAGERCECRPPAAPMPEPVRRARHRYREAYTNATYRRNRAKRYGMARGCCESCGVSLKGKAHPSGVAWECHHVIEARRFTDPEQANAVENLRVLCVSCHKEITRLAR